MSEPLSYASAGVDIDAGNKLVGKIKKMVKITDRPGVLGGIGGFGGCFDLSLFKHYKHPVLVSSTDGVGTKLKIAIELQSHETIGIDLVAMCANDLVVMGAEPLFFLDYFATGKLDLAVAESVIRGIAQGCQIANVALIGGETAEMPGLYAAEDYDLAGFCVGIVEKDQIIEGKTIKPGDSLIALASSGPHANGYSLIRRIIDLHQYSLNEHIDNQPLGKALLTPTRIYVKSLLELARAGMLKGAAHITGGGFTENIPRVLPEHCAALIDCESWALPPIFQWIQSKGQLSLTELRRTFNCGIGMVICVAPEAVSQALEILQARGENAWVVGQILERSSIAPCVAFSDEK